MSVFVYTEEYVNKVFKEIKEVDEATRQAESVVAYLHERSSEIKDPFYGEIKDAMKRFYSSEVKYIEYFSKKSFNFNLKDQTFMCKFVGPCTYADLFNGEVVFNNDPTDSLCILISQKTIGQQTLEEM